MRYVLPAVTVCGVSDMSLIKIVIDHPTLIVYLGLRISAAIVYMRQSS